MTLRLDRVSKTYRRRHREIAALAGVSLEVGPGEFMGVYGPSRSGKTTLLRIAAGLEAPDAGSVSYGGRPLHRLSEEELASLWRKEVGCVWVAPQHVPGFSVLDSVALKLLLDSGDRRRARSRAAAALEAVGAADCVDASFAELSDGERRRVAIAQAVAAKPRLLLADEPAANLGPVERDSIRSLLRSLAEEAGAAVLVTGTHVLEVLGADPIVAIDEGRIVGAGPSRQPADVIELRTKRTAGGRTSG